ncbi:unnamed protein product [Symbiodinium natans]|uniref:Uncharacterized protein n=1 Tax=Symbiodinium natans TaxID=878477 RepID=A0A812R7S3_9DINO|nr:unnamed protein product [Symbiodinium natans]
MEIKINKRLTSCVAYSKRLSSKLGYNEISCSLTRVLHDLATPKWCDDRRRINLFQSLGFEDESNCWIPTPSVTTDDNSTQGVAPNKAQSSQTDEKSYTETEIRAWTDSIVKSAHASIADLTGKLMALEQQLEAPTLSAKQSIAYLEEKQRGMEQAWASTFSVGPSLHARETNFREEEISLPPQPRSEHVDVPRTAGSSLQDLKAAHAARRRMQKQQRRDDRITASLAETQETL